MKILDRTRRQNRKEGLSRTLLLNKMIISCLQYMCSSSLCQYSSIQLPLPTTPNVRKSKTKTNDASGYYLTNVLIQGCIFSMFLRFSEISNTERSVAGVAGADLRRRTFVVLEACSAFRRSMSATICEKDRNRTSACAKVVSSSIVMLSSLQY